MTTFFPLVAAFNTAMPATTDTTRARSTILATSTKAWDARLSHNPVHDYAYYGKCMIGGVLACGLTHTAITPLDVVKSNMQVNPAKYTGLSQGLKTIASEEGTAALFKGWAPTAVGYSVQGLCKYGFYDFFKDFYSTQVGEENATKYRGLIYLAGSASAEVIADVALCPMEMVKVKVQTSPPGTFPVEFGPAVAAMQANSDSVVSLMGKTENKGKSIGQIASEAGLRNLATKGLGTRIIMIGTLTGFQWWIYDTFKTTMGMGTSGALRGRSE
ncbi:TPA: hypothetical protein N0F65_004631 [Lagenidium giganteum]|uniref:Mitochondrial phosphate carrier protein n=1 Tax=Lagenidium giganteum TaxID=4803 RepID=A0AAV2ZBD3_9STRA|nr:TPA: hypothetical protein N0F65_004631 [Lagenidium giganteum]